MKTIVMSVGGSLIAPDKIDITFLKNFRKLIVEFTKKGNKVIIITGGGNTAREYQQAGKKVYKDITDRDLDWIGIGATKINAELLSGIFGTLSTESIMGDPSKKVKTTKKIIVGAGWLPGHSSDNDAVLAAKANGASAVINLSNIEYVYNKDPRKHKDAKKMTEMTWKEFRKLVGNKWVPGAHVPFDPVASKFCEKHKLEVVVMKGNDLVNLRNYLTGKKFKGTTIS